MLLKHLLRYKYAEDHISNSWRIATQQISWLFLTLSIWGLVIFVRLFELDTLQTEMYNDIVIVYNYVDAIRGGEWPVGYVLSAGPLYHYIIMPIVALTGLNYAGLKLASVIVSLGVLAAMYGLSRQLMNTRLMLVEWWKASS